MNFLRQCLRKLSYYIQSNTDRHTPSSSSWKLDFPSNRDERHPTPMRRFCESNVTTYLLTYWTCDGQTYTDWPRTASAWSRSRSPAIDVPSQLLLHTMHTAVNRSRNVLVTRLLQSVVQSRTRANAVPPEYFWGNVVPPNDIRTRENGDTVAFHQVGLQRNAKISGLATPCTTSTFHGLNCQQNHLCLTSLCRPTYCWWQKQD